VRSLLFALALLPGAANAAPCEGPACNFDTLAPYFARLAAVHDLGAPSVHILQIGDSHSAGDVLTAAWRSLLRARIGNGGRGVLPPGRPYAGYRTQGVTVSMSPGWQIATTFGQGAAPPRPPLGLSSYSLTGGPGATMRLAAGPEMAFDRFVLCAIGPGGLTVAIGGEMRSLDFPAAPRCGTIYPAAPQTEASVAVAAGQVTITSWATFHDYEGVTLSNLGVVGSQLVHFARTDDAVLAAELRAYSPDLIVLAFGTNEGFAPRLDVSAYRATLIAQIGRLQSLRPGVPILLLGPPDALTRNPALADNAAGGRTYCPAADPSKPPLFAPPALAQVRTIQREVAAETGIAWWDWYARMGGACAAARWVADGRMRGDYVHLTDPGGRAVAQLLQDDIDTAGNGQ
jgi:lysophospholipase L1-like esterase